MSHKISTTPIRRWLMFDAATCAVMGLLLAVGAAWLSAFTRIPAELLFYAGVVLLPIAAFMAFVATRATLPRLGVWLVVEGNALWVVGSVVLLFGGWIEPNTLGAAFIGLQALVVVALMLFEVKAWRAATAAAH